MRLGAVVVAGAVSIASCRHDERPPVAASASDAVCIDSLEARAIACSGGTARRDGITLRVRLTGGSDTTFVDDTAGEAPGGFYYNGRIGRAAFHLIQGYGHETYPSWLVMSPRTGRRILALDLPVVSPDTARFATATPAWDNCSEANGTSFDIWRFTDTLPVLESRVVTQDCKTRGAWGALSLHWRTADTLEFVRVDTTAERRPMLAVHEGGGWKMTPR